MASGNPGLIPAVSRPLAPRAARRGGHPRDSEAEAEAALDLGLVSGLGALVYRAA